MGHPRDEGDLGLVERGVRGVDADRRVFAMRRVRARRGPEQGPGVGELRAIGRARAIWAASQNGHSVKSERPLMLPIVRYCRCP